MYHSLFNILSGRNTRQGLWGLPLLVALLISLWLTVETTQFATAENLFNLVAQAMPLIIAALGQLIVVLIGGSTCRSARSSASRRRCWRWTSRRSC
ncbi:hypothetical protein NKJ09_24215 [Mesorhizobium sp. M0189]|uniref:hypothetical protein n=1 Tax=unclassified Mesorhizobium TaxID=325217 RepID=UPI00333737C5